LMLADYVGLGKTVMVGLLKELVARGIARRTLVIPRMFKFQWVRELGEGFSIRCVNASEGH